MKNLIYQYWDTKVKHDGGSKPPEVGLVPPGVQYGRKNISEYAERIGADHVFEIDPPYLFSMNQKSYYGALNPLFRPEFDEYDNILTLDADIYTVDGLSESIFDVLEPDTDICMAQEIFEPRRKTLEKSRMFGHPADEQWARAVEAEYNITLPRRKDGILYVFNSGVVLWTRQGLEKAKKKFPKPAHYANTIKFGGAHDFYAADQHYINTSLIKAGLNFQEISSEWNTTVNWWNKDRSKMLFDKSPTTKFVHNQMRGERWYKDDETLWKIINLPVEEWGLDKTDVTDELRETLLK